LGKKRIKDFVKTNIKNGNIRILMLTDKQCAAMEIIIGEPPTPEEKNEYIQLLLF